MVLEKSILLSTNFLARQVLIFIIGELDPVGLEAMNIAFIKREAKERN